METAATTAVATEAARVAQVVEVMDRAAVMEDLHQVIMVHPEVTDQLAITEVPLMEDPVVTGDLMMIAAKDTAIEEATTEALRQVTMVHLLVAIAEIRVPDGMVLLREGIVQGRITTTHLLVVTEILIVMDLWVMAHPEV
jgi:hypothetical protein